MTNGSRILDQLNDRSREVFRLVVEGYLASGDPIGSRTLSRSMTRGLSAATIRNVMQDLEYLGLLDSPHVSAGRVPTQLGLRLFVDGLMEVGTVAEADRSRIESQLGQGGDVNVVLDRVGAALSTITQGASLVLMPKQEAPIRHIEFVSLAPDRALVVLVFSDGRVENRLFTPPMGQTPSSMREAANFLNALAEGRTLSELRREMKAEIAARRQEIDALSHALVQSGLAVWDSEGGEEERLIVRGQANLAEEGDGVRIFIGSENKLFSLSGSSLVVSPYMNADHKIIGAVGVIGPTRLNYGRIVPIVDYTAQLVGRIVSDRGKA